MKKALAAQFREGREGYTLIELMIGLTITALLATGVTIFSIQTLNVSGTSGNRMQALMQVENAGFWISRDVQMSENITLGQAGGFPLQLQWTDSSNDTFTVTYSVNDSVMRRSLVENGVPTAGTLIAQNVDDAPSSTNITETGGMLKLVVSCTAGKVDVSRTYDIQPRLALLRSP